MLLGGSSMIHPKTSRNKKKRCLLVQEFFLLLQSKVASQRLTLTHIIAEQKQSYHDLCCFSLLTWWSADSTLTWVWACADAHTHAAIIYSQGLAFSFLFSYSLLPWFGNMWMSVVPRDSKIYCSVATTPITTLPFNLASPTHLIHSRYETYTWEQHIE